VHCLRDDAFGAWDFHVSTDVNTVDLFESNEVCTHKRPNHIQIVNKEHEWKFAKEDVWRVQLQDGYKALASQCSDGKCEGAAVGGTWSTVYDQAMRVELDNGMRFLANFRYNVKVSLSEDPLRDGAGPFQGLKTGDYDSFDSKCDETMVGMVQTVHGSGSMKNHRAQCFYAK